MMYANVHAGCTVLLTDTYSGLVSKAVLERLGHRGFGGRLISFFHGNSAPVVNMPNAQEYSPVCSQTLSLFEWKTKLFEITRKLK